MGHGLGSFIAVLLAIGLVIVGIKMLKHKKPFNDKPSSGGIGGDAGGDGNAHPSEQ